MSAKPLIMMVAVCLLLCFAMMLLFTSDAHAQGKVKAAGESVLGNKEWDKDQLPGTKEFAIVGFSVVALIVVIKYF